VVYDPTIRTLRKVVAEDRCLSQFSTVRGGRVYAKRGGRWGGRETLVGEGASSPGACQRISS
jgi:hypothetical protein